VLSLEGAEFPVLPTRRDNNLVELLSRGHTRWWLPIQRGRNRDNVIASASSFFDQRASHGLCAVLREEPGEPDPKQKRVANRIDPTHISQNIKSHVRLPRRVSFILRI
jgi:hypothetical protein